MLQKDFSIETKAILTEIIRNLYYDIYEDDTYYTNQYFNDYINNIVMQNEEFIVKHTLLHAIAKWSLALHFVHFRHAYASICMGCYLADKGYWGCDWANIGCKIKCPIESNNCRILLHNEDEDLLVKKKYVIIFLEEMLEKLEYATESNMNWLSATIEEINEEYNS